MSNAKVQGGFRARLQEFLTSRFDVPDLHDLVRDLPEGRAIHDHLTVPTSRWNLAGEIADLAREHRQLDALHSSLLEQRPHDAGVLAAIWSLPQDAAAPPVPPPRHLPQLPIGFVERPEHEVLRAALREDRPLLGVMGLPGSGKTTAAIAALRDAPPGSPVCWIDGDDSTPIGPGELRARIARQLGGARGDEVSSAELRAAAEAAAGPRPLFVVLDEPRGRLDRLVDAARCHPRVTVVITTHDEAALRSVGVRDAIQIAGLPRQLGLELLARWAGTEPRDLPPEASELAAAIGYHAHGLRMLGAAVAVASDPGLEWQHRSSRLRTASLSQLALPGIPEATLAAVLDDVIASLPESAALLLEPLAVPPSGCVVDLPALTAMTRLTEADCRRMADILLRRSICLGASEAGLALHPVVHLRIRGRSGFSTRYRALVERHWTDRPALTVAIQTGEAELAEALVEETALDQLCAVSAATASPLHQAAFHGMVDVLDAILRCGVGRDVLDPVGFCALQYAAQAGQREMAVALVRRGLSPFRTNHGGKDAVYVALHHGHVDVAEAVVAVAPVAPGPDAALALDLQYAALRGSAALVRALLAMGAPHDPQIGTNTPLLGLAAANGHAAVVDELIRHGGSDFRRDTLGEALILAAAGGHATIARGLLSIGAATAWRGTGGRTALMQAASAGHVEVVRALLAAGVGDDQRDDEGWLAVHLAAHGHHTRILEALGAAGCALDPAGRADTRPLSVAVLSAGPSLRQESSFAIDEQGIRAHAVTVMTDLDPDALAAVRFLLRSGVAVDAPDANGRTALHHAAIGAHPALIAELLAHGARADTVDATGHTPLAIGRARAGRSGLPPLVALRIAAAARLLEAAAV